jgi:hypothetical protein
MQGCASAPWQPLHQEQQLAQLLEHHGADEESKLPGQCSFLSLLFARP